MKYQFVIPDPHQLKTGMWVGQIMVNGQRMSVYGNTKQEYKENVIKLKRNELNLIKLPNELILFNLIDNYISDNENVLSPSSVRGYKISQRNAFKDYMHLKVKDINFQKMINDECEKYAPKTVRNHWDIVRQTLKYYNISVNVKLPQVPVKINKNFLDYEQIQVFLESIKDEPAELACILALHGLRISEICALELADIDTNFISVFKSKVPNKDNAWVIKSTNKNRTSTRKVPVCIPRLLELLDNQVDGILVKKSCSFINDTIARVCKHNNLPPCTCHDLRRSFASLAYHLGWKEKTTMRVGGWSNPKTVNEIYTFLSELDYDDDIAKMKDYYKITTKSD